MCSKIKECRREGGVEKEIESRAFHNTIAYDKLGVGIRRAPYKLS